MIQPAPTARITVSSPVGDLTISEQDGAIVALEWASGGPSTSTPLLNDAADWLSGYFAGKTTSLKDLPMTPAGTDFQRRVWQELMQIPAGVTTTYSDLAEKISGKASARRAVARGCATNPVSLIIPCHRVIRGDGGLGGYRWGLERKAALLAGEKELQRARAKETA